MEQAANYTLQPTRPQAINYRRAWPAALVLLLLAPVCAELVSSSSPPLEFFHPFALATMVFSYGALAVLMREYAVRLRLGLVGLVVLSLVMGIYIEGLVCKSYFSPEWPDFDFPAGYARFLGVNWHWAVMLNVFHSTLSFLIPLALVNLIFPSWQKRPALNIPWALVLGVLVAGVAVLGWFLMPMNPGGEIYHPHWIYAVACLALIGGLVWLAPRLQVRLPEKTQLAALSPVWTGWLAFGMWFVFVFVVTYFVGNLALLPGWLTVLVQLLIIAGALHILIQLRPTLDDMQVLSLAMASLLFFGILGTWREWFPEEAKDDPSGMTFVLLAIVAFGFWLRYRLTRRQRREGTTLDCRAV
jgi:hypothetical protein